MIINLSVCLSDLPKDKIKLADNGKKYISLTVRDLQSADAYGNTHTLFVSQTKKEREAKANRTYVGRGKEVVFQSAQPSVEQVADLPVAEDIDDLPF